MKVFMEMYRMIIVVICNSFRSVRIQSNFVKKTYRDQVKKTLNKSFDQLSPANGIKTNGDVPIPFVVGRSNHSGGLRRLGYWRPAPFRG